jgi:predicted kinase
MQGHTRGWMPRLEPKMEAVYLRVDTIEQALGSSEMLRAEVGPAGYLVAYRLAEENVRIGRTVLTDSANPLNTPRPLGGLL